MAIVTQHATATADGSGDAVFIFPDVPLGQIWCGTTTVPAAPTSAVGMVTAGGELVGATFGPGSYGPWLALASKRLAISMSGLTPGVQYQAVWHADDKGREFSTYPAPITATVSGAVTVPVPLPVTGTVTADQGAPPWQVTVGNFPATQPVSGTVTAAPELAPGVSSGQVTMTGTSVTLPAHGATQGVIVRAPAANAHAVEVGAPGVTTSSGLILDPGSSSPLLPVTNSNLLAAVGTAPDLISFLVT